MRLPASASGRPRVFVLNLQRKMQIDLPALQKSAEKILELVLRLRVGRRTQLRRLEEISVLFVSDRRMASLHRQFLGQGGPTDVLTFQHGEIFISVETAQHHARGFGNSTAEELKLYIIHGLLHLNGFDDRQKKGARRMEVVQQQILRSAGRLN
jgi:probable rRNA maturation factor